MIENITMIALFDPKPIQWGFRGDPYLWDELKISCSMFPMPSNSEELEKIIRQQFQQMTLHSLDEDKHFKINHLNHGGMSGGIISPKFWRNTLIPLFHKRLQEYKKV